VIETINLLQLVFWLAFGRVLINIEAYSQLKAAHVGHVLQQFKRLAAK
jgi:hypothetical protein